MIFHVSELPVLEQHTRLAALQYGMAQPLRVHFEPTVEHPNSMIEVARQLKAELTAEPARMVRDSYLPARDVLQNSALLQHHGVVAYFEAEPKPSDIALVTGDKRGKALRLTGPARTAHHGVVAVLKFLSEHIGEFGITAADAVQDGHVFDFRQAHHVPGPVANGLPAEMDMAGTAELQTPPPSPPRSPVAPGAPVAPQRSGGRRELFSRLTRRTRPRRLSAL